MREALVDVPGVCRRDVEPASKRDWVCGSPVSMHPMSTFLLRPYAPYWGFLVFFPSVHVVHCCTQCGPLLHFVCMRFTPNSELAVISAACNGI